MKFNVDRKIDRQIYGNGNAFTAVVVDWSKCNLRITNCDKNYTNWNEIVVLIGINCICAILGISRPKRCHKKLNNECNVMNDHLIVIK